jgi:homoserine kinase
VAIHGDVDAWHDAHVATWCVRVPASSANLGPAFDALGLALAMYLEVTPTGAAAPETHPAVRAFRHAGGTGPLAVHSTFPGGRGLGFSGASRVAGLLAAARQQGTAAATARAYTLREATRLEGHADNVAASLLGGVVATGGGRATRVPLGVDGVIVVWVPDRETPTRAARRVLPEHVAFEDAVFNVGRTALLVAALASGDTESLRTATEDRLHQDARLARVPETRTALTCALRAGAWAAWLSGSGPSAAAFVERSRADAVVDALPTSGHAMVVEIDETGAVVE